MTTNVKSNYPQRNMFGAGPYGSIAQSVFSLPVGSQLVGGPNSNRVMTPDWFRRIDLGEDVEPQGVTLESLFG